MTTSRTSNLLSHGLLNSFRKADDGVVAVMFAVLLPVLIGILALGVELGLRQMEQRKLQHAADAAAISGAIGRFETGYSSDSNAELLALTFYVASQGGFSAEDGRTALRPYSENSDPDIYELHFVDDETVRVRLHRDRPGLFSRIFPGGGGATIAASADAGIAGRAPGEPFCFLGRNKVSVQGNVNIELPGCRIASNDQFTMSGAAADLKTQCAAPEKPNHEKNCTEGWLSGSEFPQGGFPEKNPQIEDNHPGICNFDESDFSGTLKSGVYCINPNDGEFEITGNDTISGMDITVIIEEDVTFKVRGNVSLDISAPTTGDRRGVLFYGLRGSELDMGGTPRLASGCNGIIVDTLRFGGTPGAGGGQGDDPDVAVDCNLEKDDGLPSGEGEISLLR